LVRDALLRAVDRGVEVALLIDGFGSSRTPETYFRELHDKGARFCRFNPSYGRRYVLRNHQKLALADDERILIGGFNVEDSYFGTVDEGAWRDIGLLLEGPAAARVSPYFDALMGWALNSRSRMKALRLTVRRFSEQEGRLRWEYGGPMQLKSPWALATAHDLECAASLDMIAAYFAPLGGSLRRIGAIARRGGVRIVTASKSDNTATISAARSTYGRLLRRGVRLFEYQPTKLHSKLLVMDNVVHIGSSNFDLRSLYLNMEMMLRVEDPAFAAQMRAYIDGEVEDSRRITAALHRQQRTLFNRLKWGLCYFIVATMDYNVSRRLNFGVDGA
jgi:cardiolipin synthase